MELAKQQWPVERLQIVADILERVKRPRPALRTVETYWARFNGTEDEREELLDHVHANCTSEVPCSDRDETEGDPYCASHDMLYSQRMLDGLLCARRNAVRWIAAEHGNLVRTTISLLAAVMVIRWDLAVLAL